MIFVINLALLPARRPRGEAFGDDLDKVAGTSPDRDVKPGADSFG